MSNSNGVSIVIVNYNGETIIQACCDSIFASSTERTLDVIVVDNASQDASHRILKTLGPRLRVILNTVNGGFSAGNNQGIAMAKQPLLFLLNNDTVLDPDTIETLASYVEDHPEVGMVAPQLLNRDRSLQITGSVLGKWRFKGHHPVSVPFLPGTALMMRTDLMRKIGGMDENFFFYNEDIDLSKRILKRKLNLVYLPTTKLIHIGGVATQTRRPASIVEGYRGGLYLCRKHYPKWVFEMYRFVLMLDVGPRWIWNTLASFWSPDHAPYSAAYRKIIQIALKKRILPNEF